jgi:hypothetical protein
MLPVADSEKSMTLDTQTLTDRMKRYTKGQFTWPDLNRTEHCAQCRLFLPGQKPGQGRCDLVYRRHGFHGQQFAGAHAIACSQFQAGRHEAAPEPDD